MTFKDYIFIKNPIGSSVRVRTLIHRFKLDENSNLNGRDGIGKKSRSAIAKLQVKYKKRKVEEMKETIQNIIKTSKGAKGYYTILGKEGQSRMIRNGWDLKSTQYVLKQPTDRYKGEETDEEFIERLLKSGYKKIKLYYTTTYIRGSYKTFAMVKR